MRHSTHRATCCVTIDRRRLNSGTHTCLSWCWSPVPPGLPGKSPWLGKTASLPRPCTASQPPPVFFCCSPSWASAATARRPGTPDPEPPAGRLSWGDRCLCNTAIWGKVLKVHHRSSRSLIGHGVWRRSTSSSTLGTPLLQT